MKRRCHLVPLTPDPYKNTHIHAYTSLQNAPQPRRRLRGGGLAPVHRHGRPQRRREGEGRQPLRQRLGGREGRWPRGAGAVDVLVRRGGGGGGGGGVEEGLLLFVWCFCDGGWFGEGVSGTGGGRFSPVHVRDQTIAGAFMTQPKTLHAPIWRGARRCRTCAPGR